MNKKLKVIICIILFLISSTLLVLISKNYLTKVGDRLLVNGQTKTKGASSTEIKYREYTHSARVTITGNLGKFIESGAYNVKESYDSSFVRLCKWIFNHCLRISGYRMHSHICVFISK